MPPAPATPASTNKTFGQRLWKSMKDFPMLYIGAFIVLLMVVVAVFAPVFAPHNPDAVFSQGITAQGTPVGPSKMFPLGTDGNGRDVLSRIIYGTRVSLTVGIVSAIINLVVGTFVGLLAGFYGKWVDNVLMRVVDVVLAFPFLLLAMAMVSVLGPSMWNILLVLGITGWGTMARLVRGQVLAMREYEYVQAERALGASGLRIMLRVILPNLFGTAVVFSMLNVGNNILTEAALSFLGIGIQPPTPSWGNMIEGAMQTYQYAPWTIWFPGLAVIIAVLGFNLLGDGLRDILDPRNTQH
ncbi:ABC transporter permease [Alicyclobacillus cycloheptanicus]|nr:ABC transporter permease [Alicyclobacillus cycloheptanicus]